MSGSLRESRPRIIPALAGSTCRRRTRATAGGDHPRVGGEHVKLDEDYGPLTGSSPRWRGALARDLDAELHGGIIPALAGSTRQSHQWMCRRSDHPRVGGEHGSRPKRVINWYGSSPRWRGAPSAWVDKHNRQRIIPALAGSTRGAGRQVGLLPDHPRVGGEHRSMSLSSSGSAGSSPRWRGALRQPLRTCGAVGIIPALAGSTSGRPLCAERLADHPRVGGEHRRGSPRRPR